MTETKRYGIEKNQARVFVKMLKTSPQKLNLVAGLIRGKDVEAALNLLTFSQKRVSNEVKKAVLSAMANAEKNHGLDVDKLFVSEAYVGKAMKLKRFRARARGRAAKVFKHFANLTIVVEEKAPIVEAKKTAKKTEAK